MEQIIEKNDLYKNLLEKSLTTTVLLLVGLLILAVILLLVFIAWKKAINEESVCKPKKKNREKQDGKNTKLFSLIEWYVSVVVAVVVLAFAFTSNIQYVLEIRHDIINEAFILHNSGYSVVLRSEPVGRTTYSTHYYISFHNGIEVVELEAKYALYADFLQKEAYSNVAIVYSEKSRKLLDMWEI